MAAEAGLMGVMQMEHIYIYAMSSLRIAHFPSNSAISSLRYGQLALKLPIS